MTSQWSRLWRSRTGWTLAALVIGTLLGLFSPALANRLDWIAHAFIRLVQSVIAPLVFASLVAGIAEVRDFRTFGGLAAKTLACFFTTTALALALGALSGTLLDPGRLPDSDVSRARNQPTTAPHRATNFLDQLIPASIAAAMADGNILQIVVFSSLFAAACLLCGQPAEPVVSFCRSVTAVMLHYTDLIMYVAPAAVASAMAGALAAHGMGALRSIAWLLFAFFVAEGFLLLFVLAPLAHFAGVRIGDFLLAVKEPAVLAFSTASSAAALPSALRKLQEFGVPQHIAAFSVPLGLSLNLAGTCVYLGVTVMFCIQFSGKMVNTPTLLLMLGTLLITSKGLTGIPRSAMVALVGVLDTFGVPTEGVAVVLGADVLMDMTRTAVNIISNCLAAAVVANWQRHEGIRNRGSL